MIEEFKRGELYGEREILSRDIHLSDVCTEKLREYRDREGNKYLFMRKGYFMSYMGYVPRRENAAL